MYIDAHTHLSNYKDKIVEALECINKYGIYTLDNSMYLEEYKESIKFQDKSKYIISSFGIHPSNAYKYTDQLESLDYFIEESPIIGEVGLDFYWEKDKTKYESQIKVFKYFVEKAKKQNKIINVHTKGAEREIIEILDSYKIEKAIIHWFSGKEEDLREMIKRGYYFTISSEIFYSEYIRHISKEIPINRLLTETDGPESEKWLSGKFPMPDIIIDILSKLAKERNLSEEEMKYIIENNFKDFVLKDINKY
ncbi:TatD family hydrolase [Clostridium sp. Marseille-Q2269]|uniref:TatD family hydrolase n=1 Tax=Clostridium sp. Marseille-Q2269 TaxID=2942205 RepID=UPI0020743F7B|nr:TatD family hydrolase [Clostridium sp. Marseille-Q2269]